MNTTCREYRGQAKLCCNPLLIGGYGAASLHTESRLRTAPDYPFSSQALQRVPRAGRSYPRGETTERLAVNRSDSGCRRRAGLLRFPARNGVANPALPATFYWLCVSHPGLATRQRSHFESALVWPWMQRHGQLSASHSSDELACHMGRLTAKAPQMGHSLSMSSSR